MNNNKLKTVTIILVVILLTLVGFFGVYTKVQNRMENQVKEYSYAADINGSRKIKLIISEKTKSEILDKDGNKVPNGEDLTDEQIDEKEYVKEDVLYNPGNDRTVENYRASKEVIEERLKQLGVQDYVVRLNEGDGSILVDIPEDDKTNDIISNLTVVSKFEIQDEETEEVLMNNDDIEKVQVLYGSSSQNSTGTAVYLSIQFNKDGAKKLEDITKKYTPTANENNDEEKSEENTNTENEGTEVTEDGTASTDSEQEKSKEKKVKLVLDDEEIMSTSFEQPITTGLLQLSYGKESTDQEEIHENADKANDVAVILRNKKMPLKYDVDSNQYVLSDITHDDIKIAIIALAAIIGIALVILIVRYKLKGLLTALSYLGFVGLFLLIIRYANVIISLEGVLAILITLILNYIFANKLLKLEKSVGIKEACKETFKNFFIKVIPLIIMSITFCFINWETINTFGMVMFWGIALIAIYNYVITVTLLKSQQEQGKTPKKAAKKGGTDNEKNK